MRTIRLLSLAALVLPAFAPNSAAQDKPALLNTLEVRELVARAGPGDHARLSAHFTALADRYTAEATRHISMARSFVGNPSRNLGAGMSTHCRRLAELNNQAATTVKELATFHRELAAGAPATAPAGGSRFEGGAGAREPTEQELSNLAAKAKTPAEHRALQEYFQTLAARYTAEGNEHVSLALAQRGSRLDRMAAHHDRLGRLARDAAKEANEAASMHKELAGVAR